MRESRALEWAGPGWESRVAESLGASGLAGPEAACVCLAVGVRSEQWAAQFV